MNRFLLIQELSTHIPIPLQIILNLSLTPQTMLTPVSKKHKILNRTLAATV
jgi:hypothetical protein